MKTLPLSKHRYHCTSHGTWRPSEEFSFFHLSSCDAESGALKNAWGHIIHKTYLDIITWTSIATEITRLESLRASLNIDQHPLSKRLPSEYENAMGRFFYLVAFLWRLAVKDLYHVVLSSPKLANYFEFVVSTKGPFATIKLKQSMKDQWPPVLHTLVDLAGKETARYMGAMSVLEEMQRVVESDPYHCASIQAQMMEELPKLAAIAQIRDAQHLHQPSVQSDEDSFTVISECAAQVQTIEDLENDLAGLLTTEHLLQMSDLNYPAWKKRTSQNVAQMRLAEANLDLFWERLDKKLLARSGKTLAQYIDNKITHRDLIRTPPWQPSKEEHQQARATPKPYHQQYTILANNTLRRLRVSYTPHRKKSRRREALLIQTGYHRRRYQ